MARLGIVVSAALTLLACGGEDGAGPLPFVVTDLYDLEYRGQPALLDIHASDRGDWCSFSFAVWAEDEGFWVVHAWIAGEDLLGGRAIVTLDPPSDGHVGTGLLLNESSTQSYGGTLNLRVADGVASGSVGDSHGEGVFRFDGPVEVRCSDNGSTPDDSFTSPGCSPYAALGR